ncbi:MAG: asparagine synthase (glutamine-hydrolyzing) [Alphaproteobacteria bacterium]|nr:asparagine synthase (glutamine-hydrolyzing) [Alphaproteobacteria bacterium]
MCGITGFIGRRDSRVLADMVARLVHRGPDDSGVFEVGPVSLGMRRLAIIDVESGQQPVHSADGTISVVFNGEIYNHVDLRRELERDGHIFKSHHSDSEVIPHLYQKHGSGFVERLNGMFAIAVWDSRSSTLHLYRDHVGIKPLYYALTPEGIVFGSEIKALLAHPAVSRSPDLIAIHHYFALKNTPGPRTAFAQIRQLRPGEMLTFSNGRADLRSWWRAPFGQNAAIGEDEAVAEVQRLLEDSVKLQMQSDVPFGAYLSGGVDSSSVVAIMARNSARPIKTFTMIYDDRIAGKDADRALATEVAEKYGTDHHEFLIRFNDLPDAMERIAQSFDEPFSGVVSTYFITRLIAEHVKVCLSGDGADEIFGSYIGPRSAAALVLRRRIRAGEIAMSSEIAAAMGEFAGKIDYLDRILDRGDDAAQRSAQYISTDEANRALYAPDMARAVVDASTDDIVRSVLKNIGSGDPVNRALALDFETLLPDQVLPFVDRLSMAHSVEVRPPFLDHRLVEYVARLPGGMKIRNGRVKHLLKRAVEGLIPKAIIDRPKEGFLMPINAWIMESLGEFVRDRLSPDRLARHGLLQSTAVQQLLAEHFGRVRDHGNRIWNLLMFQVWWERYQG